jgi:endonuclease/exonuclease/phosphatase family metal-dependent hydrolase
MGVLVAVLVLVTAACSSGSSSESEGGSGGDSGGGTTTATIRVVNQNLLHGTACPADSNRCDLPGRVALFLRQLSRAKCPEVVAIEEGNRRTVTELRKGLGACDYHLVYDDDPGQDREIVLTTLRVGASERLRLPGPLRTAYRVSLGSDAGPVDLIATHLASSSDDRPCDASTCPTPCTASDSLNTCQARQIVTTSREDPSGTRAITLLAGDLNAKPDEPTIAALTEARLVDTHLAIGNAECDPATGAQCTSGRVDDSLVDMTNPQSEQSERIDYVFLRPIARCRVVRPTGVFAAAGGPMRGDRLVFPADHSAVEASIRCRTTAADRNAPIRPHVTPSTSRPPGTKVTPAVKAGVTAAFDGLFAPNPDPDAQLSHLENGAALRDSFLARRAQVGELANQTSVRIDSFDRATAGAVDVTFSILISGAVVLDALPGQAKLVDGTWFVTTKTYCQVATLGVDTIPEPCK